MPDAQASAAEPIVMDGSPVLPQALHSVSQFDGAALASAPVGLRPPRRLRAVEGHDVAGPLADRLRTAALPTDVFLGELRRETRRADRSHAPLSLVIFKIDDAHPDNSWHADHLLERLHRMKRETDIIGLLRDDAVAVLCPDTDEAGTRGFVRKMAASTDVDQLDVEAATYPADLFDSLANGTRPQPAVAPFLAQQGGLHSPGTYATKRLLDVLGASLAVVFFAPLMLAVALAIAWTSRGPVIFRQIRLGKGGVPFTFYKFRSMVASNDDTIHRTYVESLIGGTPPAGGGSSGAPYKLQRDSRITGIGRLIRKTSIDELPQLFNVLKGDMSLVGPRPPIPYEAVKYRPWHLRRVLDLTPGITGLWQVEGRSRVSFNEMVRMDLRYCRECSLALDIRILLRTVLVVARCEGAV